LQRQRHSINDVELDDEDPLTTEKAHAFDTGNPRSHLQTPSILTKESDLDVGLE
jgi:hypothetical protein